MPHLALPCSLAPVGYPAVAQLRRGACRGCSSSMRAIHGGRHLPCVQCSAAGLCGMQTWHARGRPSFALTVTLLDIFARPCSRRLRQGARHDLLQAPLQPALQREGKLRRGFRAHTAEEGAFSPPAAPVRQCPVTIHADPLLGNRDALFSHAAAAPAGPLRPPPPPPPLIYLFSGSSLLRVPIHPPLRISARCKVHRGGGTALLLPAALLTALWCIPLTPDWSAVASPRLARDAVARPVAHRSGLRPKKRPCRLMFGRLYDAASSFLHFFARHEAIRGRSTLSPLRARSSLSSPFLFVGSSTPQ